MSHRSRLITELSLIDVCARCGRTNFESRCALVTRQGAPANLEWDHVDPSTRKFGIARAIMRLGDVPRQRSWQRLVAEARKCQLLCRPCHVEKSRREHVVRLTGRKTGPHSAEWNENIGRSQRGELNHAAKLTDAQRDEVARRTHLGERGIDLAREFHVSPQLVSAIKRRERANA